MDLVIVFGIFLLGMVISGIAFVSVVKYLGLDEDSRFFYDDLDRDGNPVNENF